MSRTSSSNGQSEKPSHCYGHPMYDFIRQRHDKKLSALRLADTPLSAFRVKLDDYQSVLDGVGSIAFGRGEELTSIRLSKSVERLFSTAEPSIIEGMPLTWTAIILYAGPRFEGSTKFSVGGSKVELSVQDLELLRSGRPWRFLSPWPDRNDCEKEVQSCEVTLQELHDTRREITKVLEKVSLVEQYLRSHREKITQSSQNLIDQTPGVIHGLDVTQGRDLCQSLAKNNSGYDQRLVCLPKNDHCPNTDLTRSPFDGDSRDGTPMGNHSAGNGTITPPANGAGKRKRLHESDFIQSLSDILDEPANEKAMRWSEDGRSVWVGQESEFPPTILDQLSAKSYQNLIRRLYYHGFHKTGGAYHHDSFIRGQPSSIQPPGRVSSGHSALSPVPDSRPRHGPRYKIIKKKKRSN